MERHLLVLIGGLAIGSVAIIGYLKLLHWSMESYVVRAADFLLAVGGAGILLAAGFATARFGLGMVERQSLFVGLAVSVAYGILRLAWVAAGLPTPFTDYDRWRDEDHRDYWNL
ncbi:hypothetical protein [Streptomyces sp. NL15-2K]|uniref:hypothetical protein n=1 Tax=Streptomyces sp. NL15-2K TaxID=376149 RepID=UPI000F5887A4|nr:MULTISPECIES: hypothetical protein [Actinomycetes]WKX15813.1 hypothetical protein Q4V64_53310 [Kutzneria buriramensis]GCB42795.1 hypothetical protein SNL152K_78 [Streptomyces sp. NL15-2K]